MSDTDVKQLLPDYTETKVAFPAEKMHNFNDSEDSSPRGGTADASDLKFDASNHLEHLGIKQNSHRGKITQSDLGSYRAGFPEAGSRNKLYLPYHAIGTEFPLLIAPLIRDESYAEANQRKSDPAGWCEGCAGETPKEGGGR